MPWAVIALAAICLLWAGMVLGISVLEAPVKFQAPSLTRAVGLDVGRVVFSAFNKVEIVWSALSFLILFAAKPFQNMPRFVKVLLPLIWLIVLAQSVFLLPMLVERSLLVVQHGVPIDKLPPSPVHGLYSSTELIKLLSLITSGVLFIRSCLGTARAQ
jgi:hypothetical protein